MIKLIIFTLTLPIIMNSAYANYNAEFKCGRTTYGRDRVDQVANVSITNDSGEKVLNISRSKPLYGTKRTYHFNIEYTGHLMNGIGHGWTRPELELHIKFNNNIFYKVPLWRTSSGRVNVRTYYSGQLIIGQPKDGCGYDYLGNLVSNSEKNQCEQKIDFINNVVLKDAFDYHDNLRDWNVEVYVRRILKMSNDIEVFSEAFDSDYGDNYQMYIPGWCD